jgi:hypothetical protein
MRGCLLLIVGVVLGVLVLAIIQIFVVSPNPLPQAPPSNSDLVILFRNDFLTRELQAQLAKVKSPISAQGLIVQAQADGTMAVAGTAVIPGVAASVPLRIIVRPQVANNRVAVSIVRADVGTLKLPGDWFQSFETQINDNINRTLANTPYKIVGTSTTVEGLIVDVVVTQ